MNQLTDVRSIKFGRTQQHSTLQVHVERLVKFLFNAKDLQRIRAMGIPPPPRAKGVVAKLLPSPVHREPDPTTRSPFTEEEFLLLPDVQAIIAIREYSQHDCLRARRFAKHITTTLAQRSLSETMIREAIMHFLRMYPPALPRKPNVP